MAFRKHNSVDEFKEFQEKVASGIPEDIAYQPKTKVNNVSLPTVQPNMVLVLVGIIVILLLWKLDFKTITPDQPQETSHVNLDQPNKISGRVLSKQSGPGGSMRLILDDPYHYKQYKVTVAPDVTSVQSITTGDILQVRGQQLGPDLYIVNQDSDLKLLTDLIDYNVITDVKVSKGIGYFQFGENISRINLTDLPDGVYSQVVVAVDSEYHIQILRATK